MWKAEQGGNRGRVEMKVEGAGEGKKERKIKREGKRLGREETAAGWR